MALFDDRVTIVPAPRRQRPRATTIGIWSLTVAIFALLALTLLPTSFVIQQPGPVFNTLGTSTDAAGDVDRLDALGAEVVGDLAAATAGGAHDVHRSVAGQLVEAVAQLVLLDTPLPQRPVLSRRDKLMIRTQQLKAEGPAFLAAWARDKLSYELARRRQAGAANEPEAFHDRAIEAAFRAALLTL